MIKYKNVAICKIKDEHFYVGQVCAITNIKGNIITLNNNISVGIDDKDFIFMLNATEAEIDLIRNCVTR